MKVVDWLQDHLKMGMRLADFVNLGFQKLRAYVCLLGYYMLLPHRVCL